MSSKKITEPNGFLKFPDGFLWGTATAAHQVEGNNKTSDWWKWENERKLVEDSGIACDHYHLYKKDFKLAKEILNNNAHRLSIEWARIEPKEGIFKEEEIDHYKAVLSELKALGIKTVVTLHHFVNPLWFTENGGWENGKNIRCFVRYATYIIENLGSLIDYWVIINEPNVYVGNSYIEGYWPPQKRNLFSAIKSYINLARAHNLVYKEIHRRIPDAWVSSAINMAFFKSFNVLGKFLSSLARFIYNYSFIFLTLKSHDYIGINYYFLHLVNLSDIFFKRPRPSETTKLYEGEMNDLGWPIYPQGLYEVTKEVWQKYNLPILITENGVADAMDEKRPRFIINSLTWAHQAIVEGVDIRGYFHWSLMDNFEWHIGRKARFGLFEVNYQSLKRTPRKSAFIYGEISKNNAISPHLL